MPFGKVDAHLNMRDLYGRTWRLIEKEAKRAPAKLEISLRSAMTFPRAEHPKRLKANSSGQKPEWGQRATNKET